MNYDEKINNFLNKQIGLSKLIVIYGPTACGKTNLSIQIAKKLNTEIISTDSRQIFKYLDIGTGKITFEEMSGIKHHMIDILFPNENYSVGEFKNNSKQIIIDLHKKGKIPILAGGTGLYINSLIYDFDIPKILACENLRKSLEFEAKKYGKEFVYNKLVEIDPEYAKEIHSNNLNYVIRAIEVKMISGKSKKEFIKDMQLKYDTLFLTPYDGNREVLYNRINLRVQKMFDDGLIDEVKSIINMGYKKDDFGLKTIGYKEVIDYLEGNISLEECIEKVKQFNRNYAKRQFTWFGKYIPTN